MKASTARDIVRGSSRLRVKTLCPSRTAQRALASSRISVAELARATTARIAFDPASKAAITSGVGVNGIEEHPEEDVQRKDWPAELEQRTPTDSATPPNPEELSYRIRGRQRVPP